MLTRRRLLLPALLLAHAGLLVVAMHQRPVVAEPPPRAITTTEIAAAAPPSLPVEVTLLPVSAAVEAPDLTDSDPVDTPELLAGQAPAGAGCDLSDAVQSGLRASPAAAAALQRIPRDARSVADAVMLWDGRWIDAASVGGSVTLDAIRTAVMGAVRAAPARCRDAPVTGPRLLIVASATGNQVIAFGSGRWTWAQLIDG